MNSDTLQAFLKLDSQATERKKELEFNLENAQYQYNEFIDNLNPTTTMNTKTLEAVATVIATITKKVLENPAKIPVSTILGLVLTLGDDLKVIGENYKSIPAEYWDTDTDEGQELSMFVKQRLSDQADNTIVDEVIGALFVSAAKIRDGVETIIGDNACNWEDKGEAIGNILSCIGRIVDAAINKNPERKLSRFKSIVRDKSIN